MNHGKSSRIHNEEKIKWLSEHRHVISNIAYDEDTSQKFEIYNIEKTGIGMFWLQDSFSFYNREEFFKIEATTSEANSEGGQPFS